MDESYRKVLLPTTRHDLVVTAADGEQVRVDTGTEEKWVVDATSQVGTNPLGHRHPEMMAAMQEFYDSDTPTMIAGTDFYHPYQRELAEQFTRIYPGNLAPGDLKVYYCNSGSEAVERGCLKSAQLARGGNTYIAFWNAFHGRTSLALSCNFSKAAHTEGYNSLFRSLPVPYAARDEDTEQCLEALEQCIVREGAANINAVIIEPIQGEGGYNVPADGFLPGVREITQQHNIPLVMDEVQASLRTGHWFACEHWDVQPDMISAAKAFSGGITPFGASLIRKECATQEEGKHSSTFGGNPKECFAALKTIQIIEQHNYLAHAQEMGDLLETEWQELMESEAVKEVRGVGLMRGIEFHDADNRDAVLSTLFEEYDVLTMSCGHDQFNPAIRFLLPVNVKKETVEQIADAVIQSVDAL